MQFKITPFGSPVQFVTVVDEHDSTHVSAARQWRFHAIAHGINTAK